MTTEGEAVRVHRLGVDQRSTNGLGKDHATTRCVARGDALGKRANVGIEAQTIRGEPATNTTEAGDHFVAPEQHAVAVADLADLGAVAVGRWQTATVLNRLDDDCCDRIGAFSKDRLLDGVGAGQRAAALVVAVEAGALVRVDHVADVRIERLERHARQWNTRQRQCAHRAAVVRAAASNDLALEALALGEEVLTHELECGLDRLRTTRCQQDASHAIWCETKDAIGQRKCRRVRGGPVGVEAERLELCRCCLANLGAMRVANLGRKETRDAVEQAIAIALNRVDALARHDHRRRLILEVGHLGPVQPLALVGVCGQCGKVSKRIHRGISSSSVT